MLIHLTFGGKGFYNYQKYYFYVKNRQASPGQMGKNNAKVTVTKKFVLLLLGSNAIME